MKPISTILVPQGAEYQAVCKGLQGLPKSSDHFPQVQVIPVGMDAFQVYLETNPQIQKLIQTLNKHPNSNILLTGLCGSLTPEYQIGDRLIYRACRSIRDTSQIRDCDRELAQNLFKKLNKKVEKLNSKQVTGLTCDRMIHKATEKCHLGQTFGCDVVDMESFIALDFFEKNHIPMAILRVVSDDCLHDLPDLNSALDNQGKLQTFPLMMEMLAQPIAASRLIKGSLRGLSQLTSTIKELMEKGNN